MVKLCIIYIIEADWWTTKLIFNYLDTHGETRARHALCHGLVWQVVQVWISHHHEGYFVNLLDVDLAYNIVSRPANIINR